MLSVLSRGSRATGSRLFSSTTKRRSPGRRLLRYLGLGSLVGTGSLAVNVAWTDYRQRQDPRHYYSDWKIRLYTSLPLAAVSRCAGEASRLELPLSMRKPLLGSFAKAYGCRLDEAVEEDLTAYSSFANFFNRDLRPETRPISAVSLVAPADGRVLHYGIIDDRRVEFVKGNDYDVEDFLGPSVPHVKKGNDLYQVVVYLAPGDYHAFHSPADWQVSQKVHHPGFLLSVKPSILDWIPKLFCINERVVMAGNWKHGYFSMTAVAATNVGDIQVDVGDEQAAVKTETHEVATVKRDFSRGDKVGEFRLGSTVVLIFEAPRDTKFAIKAGDKLRYGQSLVVRDI